MVVLSGHRKGMTDLDIVAFHNHLLSQEAIAALVDRYEGFLFDLDGTLVDTMPLHYRAYAEVLGRRGVSLSSIDFMACIGEPARQAIPRFLSRADVASVTDNEVAEIHEEKKKSFDRILSETTLVPLPATAILMAARGRRKLGLVSSGNKRGVHALLSAMQWTDLFDIVISGDDVTRGKPNPEPYLAAAGSLNIDPEKCLVLEDTQMGLDAGAAAGMAILDVSRLIA